MRIYLDLCCLKRPFDGQEQPIVRLQTEAVLTLMALPSNQAELIRAPAQALENSLDPVQIRREAVAAWLAIGPMAEIPDDPLKQRMLRLVALGFKSFDAFHLASAELTSAAMFLTVDLPFLRLAQRIADELHVRVSDPIRFLEELAEWTH